MKETTVGVSQVGDCGIGGSPLFAALPGVEQRKALLVRAGEDRALQRVVDELELVPVLLSLPTLVAAGDDPALAERQAGDDALQLMVPLGIRPEDGGDVRAVQRHIDVVEIRPVGHGDLDPRIAAGDVLRRARHDADLELVVLLSPVVIGRGSSRGDDERGE